MTAVASLASLLPLPKYDVYEQQPVASTSTPAKPSQQPSQALVSQKKPSIPKYGHRQGWKPKDDGDFADGGAYPECHLAQYPLGLGKKAVSAGATLALQVDKDGKVRYDAIAQRGHSEGVRVQSAFKDLVPMALRTDITKKEQEMERPSEDEVMSTAEKTRLALEKIVNTRIAAAQPKNVPGTSVSKSSYVRYTPGGPNTDGTSQRIIKMTEVAEDPLEPPRFKHKKVPRGPSSPPPPVLRSPPRRATAQDQKDWMIPPCVSNWKNNKGYTIPLDKRLAADGRGLQDIHINDKFATFSESLYIADRHARDEVRQRAAMQQRIAEKEKEAKEETLRLLAARARDDRAGMTPAIRAGGSSTAVNALAGYGSGSEDGGSDSGGSTPRGEAVSVPQARLQDDREEDDDEDDTEEARERDRMRAERRKERERELRMNNMGSEQRARVLARAQNRDISEKVALGLAKPTLSKESMLDSRLFNQEQYSSSFGDDEQYHLYDRPLFQGSSAAAAIYKPMSNSADNEEAFGGGNEEGIRKQLQNDRFELGTAAKGFEGASDQAPRSGPVQFEKDTTTADPFGVSAFLEDAKRGAKRGQDGDGRDDARKRQR